MSGALTPMGVLRAAALLGGAIEVGGRPPPGTRLVAAQSEREPDPFEQGYAAGLEKGGAAGYEHGHAEGVRSGHAEGLANAKARLEAEISHARRSVEEGATADHERLVSALAAVSAARQQVLDGAEGELAALGFELACKVLGPALASAAGVRAQVKELLEQTQGPVTVRVHPAIATELALQPHGEVRWVADEDVSMGGALVQHGAATVDARLETILANFKSLLLRSLEERDTHEVVGAAP